MIQNSNCLTESADLIQRRPDPDVLERLVGSHQYKGSDFETHEFKTEGTDKVETELGDITQLEHEIFETGTVEDF